MPHDQDTTLTQQLDIESLTVDFSLQQRKGMDASVVAEYAECFSDLPAIHVVSDGSTHYVVDGFHRVAAAQKVGAGCIRAVVARGTLRDAVLASVGANAAHGLRRTNADKRKAVRTLLEDEEWGGWSNREIARRCHVSDVTVAKYRGDLDAKVCNETRKFNTRHGTVGERPVKPKADSPPPAKHTPPGPPPPAPPKFDALGLKPDRRAAYAFDPEWHAEHREVQADLRRIAGRVRDLAAGEPGAYIPGQEVDKAIKDVCRLLKDATPHTTCLLCRGRGCQTCKSRGYITASLYPRIPADTRAMWEAQSRE